LKRPRTHISWLKEFSRPKRKMMILMTVKLGMDMVMVGFPTLLRKSHSSANSSNQNPKRKY